MSTQALHDIAALFYDAEAQRQEEIARMSRPIADYVTAATRTHGVSYADIGYSKNVTMVAPAPEHSTDVDAPIYWLYRTSDDEAFLMRPGSDDWGQPHVGAFERLLPAMVAHEEAA